MSLTDISDKACMAIAFDGSSAVIPKSQIYGPDYDAQKSNAWWIAAWILERKNLQYSPRKVAWFDERGKMLPTYSITRHIPEKHNAVDSNEVDELHI